MSFDNQLWEPVGADETVLCHPHGWDHLSVRNSPGPVGEGGSRHEQGLGRELEMGRWVDPGPCTYTHSLRGRVGNQVSIAVSLVTTH